MHKIKDNECAIIHLYAESHGGVDVVADYLLTLGKRLPELALEFPRASPEKVNIQKHEQSQAIPNQAEMKTKEK